MDQYTTVREAVKLSGKSESTIKRLIHEIVKDENHADRSMILPAHDELERRRKVGEPYVWKIDKALLERRFPKTESTEEGSRTSQSTTGVEASSTIIEVLRDQLQSKDRQLQTLETQLDRKDQQIENLNDRMHESNVLMNELQKRLAITGPTPAKTDDAVAADVVDSEEGTASSTKKAADKKTTKSSGWKRTFFGRSKSK